MIITKENYFSQEAAWECMGSTQYKTFVDCEHRAMGMLRGDWQLGKKQLDGSYKLSDDILMGKYCHAYFESPEALEKCKTEYPQMFLTKKSKYGEAGDLKKDFLQCDEIIQKIESDPLFMQALQGQKEVIFTAEMFGMMWKVLLDSYFLEKKRFTDLKILKSLYDKQRSKELGIYENVFEFRGYFDQIAIYSEIERLSMGRPEDDYIEPFIAVATKETPGDKAILSFNTEGESHANFITTRLEMIKYNMPRIKDVKEGKVTPVKCGVCEYCRETKKLRNTVHYSAFAVV